VRTLICILASATLAAAAPPRVPDAIDSPMTTDPLILVSEAVPTFPPGILDLWMKALERPEHEARGKAAASMALAHQRGMAGVSAAVPALVRALEVDDQPASVRVAVARALVVLDARDAAAKLFAHVRTAGADYRVVVEPALAAWDFKPARAEWLDRLKAGKPDHDLTLAMRGLAAVREESAAPRLRELALNADLPAVTRIEAARAAVRIQPTADAAPVPTDVGTASVTTRLVAVTLLTQRSGDAAVKHLQAFARDREPAVALVAVNRLLELDPKLVLPVKDAVLGSLDYGVRLVGVEALSRTPSAEHVKLLGDRLDDPHPDVQTKARIRLRELADRGEWKPAVVEQAVKAVNAKGWRPHEQGAMLLAQLGHTGEMKRLIELLKSDRPEVMIASAWAVRVLAVPDTFPDALKQATARREQSLASRLEPEVAAGVNGQLAQLAQLFGTTRYRPADAELRRQYPRFLGAGEVPVYNPRGGGGATFNPIGGEARAAAIWALGLIHENAAPADLTGKIEERMTGDPGRGPDHPAVRRAAAVALGRMKASKSLGALKDYSAGDKPSLEPLDHACRWAVARLTGTAPPPAGKVEVMQRGWFLEPQK
jgi:HEAT repeat protein